MIKEHSNGRAASFGAASTNGAARYQSEKVRVAIVGVGNCASSFVQGVHYYRDADPDKRVPGLMHVDLGGYHVRDIEFTAAFDIDSTKVGKDLGVAIWAGQNNTIKFAKGAHAVPKKLGIGSLDQVAGIDDVARLVLRAQAFDQVWQQIGEQQRPRQLISHRRKRRAWPSTAN